MKKLVSLILAIAMVLACCAAFAEAPEGYPEVREGIDFGGALHGKGHEYAGGNDL